MFIKHYAPNRCLYIKVAKLRTGVGSAEMSHLQNCSQDGCERRIKIFSENSKNNFFFGGGVVELGGIRMDVNEELN